MRRARDLPRRRAAGIPDDLEFATKPQLAMNQLGRLTAAGLPARWAAFDEVYGRSEELRKQAAKANVLGAARSARHHDLFHHHRRAEMAGGRNVQDRQRR